MSQVVKKFIGNNQVDETKIRLSNNANLKARNAADSADVNILKVNASDRIEFASMPQSSATPSVNADLTNKLYVDTAVAGASTPQRYWLDSVAAASTADIDVATGGLLTIDGTPLTSGERVLVKDNTPSTENGIYIADAGPWTRATDFDVDAETSRGAGVFVQRGQLNILTRWAIYPVDVLGSDPVTVVRDSYRSNTEALTLNGTDITNQYKDLSQYADSESIMLFVDGVMQRAGTDYTISVVGSITRLTFAGDLATGGNAALISGDVLHVMYRY